MTVGIVSCFSGVGGLEGSDPALAFCESDEQAQIVLRGRHPEAKIHDDIATFQPPKAEVVLGGWPCQDISVAGNQAGLTGERSGLFYELLRVAEESNCRALVAENVVNLLRLDNGKEFASVLKDIRRAGFDFISWRVHTPREIWAGYLAAKATDLSYGNFKNHCADRWLTDGRDFADQRLEILHDAWMLMNHWPDGQLY